MWKRPGEIALTTGDKMEIFTVKPPDDRYARDYRSFLSIYRRIRTWHMDLSFHGESDELDSRYYLGFLKSKLISNVSTWQYGLLGIKGHLFTPKPVGTRELAQH